MVEENFYDKTYEEMFYSSGKSSLATKLIHIALERKVKKNTYETVLEVGGGAGLHFPYVKHTFSKYQLTDLLSLELTEEAKKAELDGILEFSEQNAERLSITSKSVDRTIFMCVLHHLGNPEEALKEARRVTRKGGLVSIYLPCDPGLLYRQTRKLFTRGISKKLGIDYELINVREHINHHYQLSKLIDEVFKDDLINSRTFPFFSISYDFNLYSIYHIEITD